MKSILQNLALITISCIFAVVVAELGLRIVGYESGNPLERLLNHPDYYVGYRMIPGDQETVPGPGGVYEVEIVSLGLSEDRGFRDDGIDSAVESVFFGDSFVWGYGVNLTDSVSERYQQLSGKPAVNLGMTSYTSPQQYARLFRKYGPELQPKYAFFGIFIGNDFPDGANFDNWLLSDKSLSFPMWHTRRTRGIGNTGLIQKIRLLAYRNSAVWRMIGDRINFSDKKSANKNFEYRQGNLDLVLVPDQIQTELGPDGERQKQLFKRALREITRVSEQFHIRAIAFVIPTKEQVYQDRFPPGPIRRKTDKHHTLALQFLKDSGLEYVDLLPPFKDAAQDDSKQLYFRIDGHWTPAGHKLAATMLRNYVDSTVER